MLSVYNWYSLYIQNDWFYTNDMWYVKNRKSDIYNNNIQ